MVPPSFLRAGAAALGLVVLGCDGGLIADPGAEPGADPVHTGRPPGDPLSDPGRVTLHRLNRVEYNNTVRDLLGTSQTPADDFPPDDRGYGFDNIADVLSTSPLHLEMYQAAAETLVNEAMGSTVSASTVQLEAETVGGSVGSASGAAWNLFSAGEIASAVELPGDGSYRVSVRAWQQAAGPDPAQMTITLGGRTLSTVDVTATSGSPAVYEATADMTRGSQVVSVAFLNDYYDAAAGADRNLFVDWIRIEGPLGATTGGTPARSRILVCEETTDACAREVVESFALRAWRRPPASSEVDGLMELVTLAREQGDDWEQGIRLALQAVLVSPHFLYRVEVDPDPTSTDPHPLSDWELASRLSYFLWSSMPDDELFELAQAGELQDRDVLRAQAMRMLDDPRAAALVDNFAGQWLFARKVDDHAPDYAVYPAYDAALGESMKAELNAFFRAFLDDDIPVDEMLTADWTFVDDRLAAHYGVPAPGGSELTRVTLPPERRAGLLGKGAILMVTSHPTRTSPVRRGVWVLEQLLCAAPPPPPPGVEGLEEQELTAGTLRERMEMHRRDPVCASCHQLMDPIGLGLENFDGIGAYRDEDAGETIDASGTLPSGETFSGAVELGQILSQDERFTRCLTKQMMTYALGRGMEPDDDAWLDELNQQFRTEGATLRALVLDIVSSDPFRMRRGEEVSP